MVAHLGHIRTNNVFFDFPSKRKSLILFPQVKIFSVFVSARKSIFTCGNKTKDMFTCGNKSLKYFYLRKQSQTFYFT